MPRKKEIIFETAVDTEAIERFKSIDIEEIKQEHFKTEQILSHSILDVFKTAQDLHEQNADEEELASKYGLFSTGAAYDFLKDKGVFISFRAFGGRIERGTIPFVKVGRKRYIPKSVLDDITNTKSEFFSVKEAYNTYKKFNPKINFRAFIGRVEKGSVPSVKFGTRRLVPKNVVLALSKISENYYSVTEAINVLHRRGIEIKRNAFERRLDRGNIPHSKVVGRRFIHEDVLSELVEKEKTFHRNLIA